MPSEKNSPHVFIAGYSEKTVATARGNSSRNISLYRLPGGKYAVDRWESGFGGAENHSWSSIGSGAADEIADYVSRNNLRALEHVHSFGFCGGDTVVEFTNDDGSLTRLNTSNIADRNLRILTDFGAILKKYITRSQNMSKTTPIRTVTLNGHDLSEYTIIVPDYEKYGMALTYITRYLRIYTGYELPVRNASNGINRYELVFGQTDRIPDRKYGRLDTEIIYDNGHLIFGAFDENYAAMVFDRFVSEYLSVEGDIEINLPEGEPVYSGNSFDWADCPALLSNQDRIVRSALRVQGMLEEDWANGIFYSYQHVRFKSSIAEARETGVRVTNCVIVMNWVMKDAGFYSKGIINHLYNGTVGYTLGSDEIRSAVADKFTIIETDKTIKQLGDEGGLYPGDLIFFLDYNADHNQIALNNITAIDGGRGNCLIHEVGAPFARFVGPNRCMNARVGLIFRANDAVL